MISSLSGKRVFVTGATGFIGGYLARRLHSEGAHVLALERTPGKGDALKELGIELVQGDITDHARMSEFIGQDVQIAMHIAGWLLGGHSAKDAEAINVTATRHLAQAASAAGVERFVYTSSVAVYGLQGDTNVDETVLVEPFGDPYGDTKIRAEEAIQEVSKKTGLAYSIVRPGVTYGPGAYDWTVRMVEWAKKGKIPLIGGGKGTFYPIYITDLIDLLVLCAVHPNAVGEVFNGLSDGPVTRAEFFGGYMKMIPTERAKRIPCWVAKLIAGIISPFFSRYNLRFLVDQNCGRGWISNQKAKDCLGWKPKVSLNDGMKRCEDWLRAQGIL
jgi:nucleoside-diphosphate-sugar epimerase